MNFDKYIGLPYQENGRTEQGVDCWGLARLVYKQEFGIELPDYSDLYSGSWDEQVTKLINYHKDTWQEVKQPEVGDLCLFNIYGEPAHIGVYVGDSKFLHSRDGQDTVIESLNNSLWKRRLAGYFSYQRVSGVEIVGAPHPLKIQKLTDWTAAGTTVADLVKFLHAKYKISEKLSTRLVLMIDGVPIAPDKWDSTTLREGQQVSYRTLAQGRGTGRMLLMFAIMVAAVWIAGPSGFGLGESVASATGLTVAQGTAIAVAGVQMAGMILLNAIAPIRPPDAGKDPGQPNQLNLFNGSSNQINRLGAIPVVLGKLRYVGLHGATPYIETNTNSNILNMMIIWGFGPLDVQDICVGATNLEKAYYDDLPGNTPRPITLYGSFDQPQGEVDNFNKLYPTDVEQVFKNVELTNNPTDGNPWQEITFVQESTRVDIAFNFPEGMRRIKTKGDGAGDVTEANCSVEVQIAKYTDNFGDTPALNPGGGNQNAAAYTKTLGSSSISFSNGYDSYNTVLYRWYDICIGPGGVITEFVGAATQDAQQEPNQDLLNAFNSGNYNSLLGVDNTYTRLPDIPAGYTRLYRVCLSSAEGLLPQYTVNYLQGQSGYIGLQLTYTNEEIASFSDGGGSIPTGKAVVNISGGSYYPGTAPTSNSTGTQTIFQTSAATVPGTNAASIYSGWCDLLKTNGIWVGSNSTIDVTAPVTITTAGMYDFEASVDDTATITISGRPLFDLPKDSWSSVAVQSEYLEPGQYTLRIQATNTGGPAAAAVKISYTPNSGANTPNSPQSIFTVGTPTFFYKRKDPFNHVYRVVDLPRARYKLRVRRVDAEYVETEASEYRYLNKVVVSNATCFDNTLPMANLPRGRLARTAIKVQSTSKANGQVDGINALLQTQAYDWDRTTNTWKFRSTNNPASLFLYVLMHPANAYRLADMESATVYSTIKDKVDLDKIIEWHNFCNPTTPTDNNPILTYNSVITSTQSIMDTLRDICAAGKASPIFLDGKWSVVIDKPRQHVVQHFTPHNSWGFESNKLLPRIPHAFRVTIQDEETAYQAKEVYAYNYGYNMYGTDGKQAAEIFEELQLPGVTNTTQALHLARWHLAQLKLRPEVYSLNTDFEYLVCNRGDLVRVTHDVPLWGLGSGRIKTITANTKTIQLTEQVLLAANPTGANYKIRIRTNDITATAGSGSQYLTLERITTTGYYDTITVVETIPNNVEVDNLFMLGTENTETQELVVLSVEPGSNLTARITLVDYSPQIYTADLANDLITYNPNTTLPSTGVVENTIVGTPIIASITSSRETSQEISTGIYQITALLTFNNPTNLSKNADRVQFEMVRSDQVFSTTNPATLYFANKETGNITFTGLESGQMYKVRARYCNNIGSIFGNWTTAEYFVAGTSGLEPATPTLAMDLEDTYIVARVPQTFVKSADFQTFEYRIYKDTGVEDFWELTPDNTNNIKVIQNTAEARFNLLDMPTPRLSQQGVTYRVACRALNRNGEYSTQSALGTLVVTTIT